MVRTNGVTKKKDSNIIDIENFYLCCWYTSTLPFVMFREKKAPIDSFKVPEYMVPIVLLLNLYCQL